MQAGRYALKAIFKGQTFHNGRDAAASHQPFSAMLAMHHLIEDDNPQPQINSITKSEGDAKG